MHSSSFLIAAVGLLTAGMAGCGSTLQIQSCPNPVLLGPVDRVGGHRMQKATPLNKLEGEAELLVSVNAGPNPLAFISDKSGRKQLALDAVERTEGRADRDIRVKRLPVGAWALILAGMHETMWAGLEGQIVEVPRGR